MHDIVWNPNSQFDGKCYGNLATGSSDTNIRLWTFNKEKEL